MNVSVFFTGKTLWRGFYLLNWLVLFSFWFWSASTLLFSSPGSTLLALGQLLGLSGAYMILTQFFLVGRNPFLERYFGLDKLTQLHHTNGRWGLSLIFFHPIVLVFGYAMISGVSPSAQFITFLQTFPYVLWAVIGIGLFAVVGISSLAILRLRLRYEWWRAVHLLVYAGIFLAFWHQITNGATLLLHHIFYWYWILLYVLIFTSHFIFRFARPFYSLLRHHFVVNRVARESPTSVSVSITGKDLHTFPIRSGQFMILRFLTKGMWWQAHPFSLSKMADGGDLRITVRELGDFTKNIENVPLGTKVIIDGPYGVFTDTHHISQKVLFVAGGIGITPVRSLMEQMLEKGKDVTLLYGNKKEHDIILKEEIDGLRKKHTLRVTHVLSQEETFEGEVGFIDAEKLLRLVPDIAERDVFLCGPPPMMEAILSDLKTLSIPKSQIHFERFAF